MVSGVGKQAANNRVAQAQEQQQMESRRQEAQAAQAAQQAMAQQQSRETPKEKPAASSGAPTKRLDVVA
jgi:hypothetical protein